MVNFFPRCDSIKEYCKKSNRHLTMGLSCISSNVGMDFWCRKIIP